MSRRFLAAAVQLCAGADKERNVATAERLARAAARQGAVLVVLPENFLWRGPREQERDAAEPVPGPATERLARLAAELGVFLVGGSLLERAAGAEKVYNTCTAYSPRGELIGRYRKLHLFDVDIRGHLAIRESDTRSRGDATVVVPTELGTVGLSICYDLRFPELYRRLTDGGAQIVCVPSAFTFATGAAHWEALLRARAIENQVYLIAPNQHGRGPAGFPDYGHSMIVDPWGTPVARASNHDASIVAEIDLDYLDEVREQLPCLRHRTLPG
jgi:predicted amidohydrolase